jgi:hypothetical protein
VAIGAAGNETDRDSTRAPLSAWPDNSSAAQKSSALDTSAVHTLGSHCTIDSLASLALRREKKWLAKNKKMDWVSALFMAGCDIWFCRNADLI